MKVSISNSNEKQSINVHIFQTNQETVTKQCSPKGTLSVDIPADGQVVVKLAPEVAEKKA